jgi:hypothetical protein
MKREYIDADQSGPAHLPSAAAFSASVRSLT